jgi:hypothetical protein
MKMEEEEQTKMRYVFEELGNLIRFVFSPLSDPSILAVLYKGFHLGNQKRTKEEVVKALGEEITQQLINHGYLEETELGELKLTEWGDFSMSVIGNIAVAVKHSELTHAPISYSGRRKLRKALTEAGLLELPDDLLRSYEPVRDLAEVEKKYGRDVHSRDYLASLVRK